MIPASSPPCYHISLSPQPLAHLSLPPSLSHSSSGLPHLAHAASRHRSAEDMMLEHDPLISAMVASDEATFQVPIHEPHHSARTCACACPTLSAHLHPSQPHSSAHTCANTPRPVQANFICFILVASRVLQVSPSAIHLRHATLSACSCSLSACSCSLSACSCSLSACSLLLSQRLLLLLRQHNFAFCFLRQYNFALCFCSCSSANTTC